MDNNGQKLLTEVIVDKYVTNIIIIKFMLLFMLAH